MWTAWLRGIDDLVELAGPVGEEHLARAEAQLGHPLPAELRSLLAETDGLVDASGGEPVWPLERIVAENADPGGGAPPPAEGGAGLFFFGDAGGEDLFAYRAHGAARPEGLATDVLATDVLIWEHEQGAARWAAPDLQALLDEWLSRDPSDSSVE